MHNHRLLSLLLCAAMLAALRQASPANAQSNAANKATAEALFDQGMALMAENKLAEACQRFERSQTVEPGIGTMLYLADCYERIGRTASAWALFREASSLANAAGQRDRALAGTQRAQALQPKLSHVTLNVPADSRVPGLSITRNGAPVPASLWGLPLPVDPGDHQLRVNAPGHMAFEVVLKMAPDGSQLSFDVPRLKPSPAADVAANQGETNATDSPSPIQGLTESASLGTEDPGATLRTVGLIVAGVGVASLAVGAGFGVRAMLKDSDADEDCEDTGCRNERGASASESAVNAATISTVTFAAGAALVTGGLLTYLLAPEEQATTVALAASEDGAMLQVGGVF